ncbi:DUF805 domain-containing protein [Bifidobacterium myosotis]|uniref:DUF805 domain-containing protein n=1 Tax=Bifidobacterium myosotis TaxID=1630166 RepID=A0A5M9ZIS6_9BIFI|nr:DUF805 domain-containing protein [Bifidobacterium myosotis]KAA8826566.1 DUF805 domain-containing protein [Bifidobacterium myosotis]
MNRSDPDHVPEPNIPGVRRGNADGLTTNKVPTPAEPTQSLPSQHSQSPQPQPPQHSENPFTPQPGASGDNGPGDNGFAAPCYPAAGNPSPNPYAVNVPQPPRQWLLHDEPPLWAPWYGIGFGKAIARFFRKTFIFHGRASRGEYWWAFLFNILVVGAVGVAAYGVGELIGVSDTAGTKYGSSPLDDFMDNAAALAQLVLFIPNLSLAVRRLHDENRRGWWVLLPAALQIGAVAVFIGTIIAMAQASGGTLDDVDSAQAVIVSLLAFFGMYLLSLLASIVLMIGPSNPKGMRFDRPGAPRYPGQ